MTPCSKINRRSFLRKASAAFAGAVGFPYLISPSALGKNGYIAPSNRITMAAIGCGSMGRGNMDSFLQIPEVQIVAVCDVDQNHLRNAKNAVDRHYGNQDCRSYGDYRQLLAKEKVDTAMLALPDHWHAAMAVACIREGIDIYGEKPLARTIREGRAICDAVARYGTIWQTGSWQRSIANFHRGSELVRNGRIGKVHYVEVGLPDGGGPKQASIKPVPQTLDWEMWLGPAPWRPFMDFGGQAPHWDWRWIMDYSGGQLTDWAGHHIDIAHWGLGLDESGPVTIEGQGKYHTTGVYDTPYAYSFECEYATGVKIRVANASALPKGMGTVWYGDQGWIHVDRGDRLDASDPKILQEKIGPEEIRLYKSSNHQQNFIDCVKSRRETITPARIAHRSISVGLLGEIAMLTGRKLHWDPAKEEFINDSEANRYLSRSYRSPWRL
ncbi:Gfo/Idh/MocA family protein [Anaerohalosphaeraceae bacterium U12dextr]